MRFSIKTGTSIAFTFLALVVVSEALIFWLPFWKETTVFRYHPKKGWHAIKHGGSSLWKPKKPLRIPPLAFRHRHRHHPHDHHHPHHHPHHHHHHPPPFHHNPFRHFHPHRRIRPSGPHVHSPVHLLQKFKQWKPKSLQHHHHHHHKPLCAACHLTSWKPRKLSHHNNGLFFNQPPFSSIHHDFPKFGPFPNPADIFPQMGPIFPKFKSNPPKIKTILKIRKVPKQTHNRHKINHFKLKDLPISQDPYRKINSFQKTSPYPAVSHYPRSHPFLKNYYPKQPHSIAEIIGYPHAQPYSGLNHSPKVNPYHNRVNHYPRSKPSQNPFSAIEESPPLFSSQFSLGDNNFGNNNFPKVNHFPTKVSHHPQEASPIHIPKEFTNFGLDGRQMGLSGFATGKRGNGWGGWDW